MREFTLSCADVCQVASNTLYPHAVKVDDDNTFVECLHVDHVAGCLKGGQRRDENVYDVDCVIMDCDNPDDARTYRHQDVFAYLGRVEHWIAPSRNNNKPKGPKPARPRWHAYFPLSRPMNADEIEALRAAIYEATENMFDRGAASASRLIYGNPEIDIFDCTYIEGRAVDEILATKMAEILKQRVTRNPNQNDKGSPGHNPIMTPQGVVKTGTAEIREGVYKPYPPDEIREGERHSTLLKTAVNAVNNHSLEDARRIFENACARCKPRIDDNEAAKIWEWAVSHKDDKQTARRGLVTMRTVEEVLREHNITLSFNVISRIARVSELPSESQLLPAGYASLSARQRAKAAEKLLPTFIETYFGENGVRVPRRLIEDELACIAEVNRYNPVREMIEAKEWDGSDRIKQLTSEVMKLAPRDAALATKWLHQAVAMGLNDEGELGGQFMLVLQGAQGIGKTELFRHLAYDASLFGEGLSIDMRDKDTIIQASTVWIGEIGELDSTLKREQANLKSFITAKFDTYRKPYARNAEQVERHTCFCGTVNPEQVLRDETGHRRYVILHVDALDLDFIHHGMTKDWVQQLWAQVYTQHYLPSPCGFFLSQDEQRDLKQRNVKYVIPLEGETELCDKLNWAAARDEWQYKTLSTLKQNLSLTIDPRKISRALVAVFTKQGIDSSKMRRLVNGRTEYILPPLWFEGCDISYEMGSHFDLPQKVSTFEERQEPETPKEKTRVFKNGGLRF